jgi:hypothetical protein
MMQDDIDSDDALSPPMDDVATEHVIINICFLTVGQQPHSFLSTFFANIICEPSAKDLGVNAYLLRPFAQTLQETSSIIHHPFFT